MLPLATTARDIHGLAAPRGPCPAFYRNASSCPAAPSQQRRPSTSVRRSHVQQSLSVYEGESQLAQPPVCDVRLLPDADPRQRGIRRAAPAAPHARVALVGGGGWQGPHPNECASHNVYHALVLCPAFWCLAQAVESLTTRHRVDDAAPVTLVTSGKHAAPALVRAMIHGLGVRPNDTETTLATAAYEIVVVRPGQGSGALVYSWAWSRRQAGLPMARTAIDRALRGLRVDRPREGWVSVVFRGPTSTRQLLDVDTGRASDVVRALCERGLRVRAVTPRADAVREVIETFAGASMAISVHGAQLTNVIFMRADSAVLEVLMRVHDHWCDARWHANARSVVDANATACPPYFLGMYANLARAVGLRYRYHDAAAIEPRTRAAALHTPAVYVRSRHLAAQACALHHVVRVAA